MPDNDRLITPSDDDVGEARRLRNFSLQYVDADYQIQEGVMSPTTDIERRVYLFATAFPAVGEIGRLHPGDEAAATALARRWGLLGYSNLIEPTQRNRIKPSGGDPMGWVWAHANGIRTVLELSRLLANGDPTKIQEYLTGLRLPVEAFGIDSVATRLLQKRRFSEVNARIVNLQRYEQRADNDWSPALVFGDRDAIAMCSWQLKTIDPRVIAHQIIESVMNRNLTGVYRQISSNRTLGDSYLGISEQVSPQFGMRFFSDSLISATYWHLANIISESATRECLDCGTLFFPNDRRQRFCPKADFERESRCALRHRQRRQRKRHTTP